MVKGEHFIFLNEVKSIFGRCGYEVYEEVPLDFGKGSVDIFARKGVKSYYCEVKSSPATLKKKKVIGQLRKYRDQFGRDSKYLLICPGARNFLRVSELDNKNKEGILLENYLEGLK